MTVEYLREVLQHGNGHLTKPALDEAFALFNRDAEGECLYIPDFMDLCYMLLRETTGELTDPRIHRCANAYITNIQMRHHEQEDMLYFLYNREAEYYALQLCGAETIYYAERILQLKHVQPQFYATALLYIHNALLSAGLPVYHERYSHLLRELTSSIQQDAPNVLLLTVSLMDLYSQMDDLPSYLQARADTEKLLERLPLEHLLCGSIRLHLIATTFSFPQLVSERTAEEQLADFRRCIQLLQAGTGVADTVSTIFTPMLNRVRELMPLTEFVDCVRQIIAAVTGDHDRLQLYTYLADECGVTAEAFPELYADYFRALRADRRFRKEMDRRAIEINMLQNDLHNRYKSAALTDRLTGVLSRYAYQNDLALLKADDSLVVLVVDVNRLKYINDTFGHDAGDTALVQAANWLTECFAGFGKIYRYGGDEFFIIAHSGAQGIHMAVEKLRALSAQAAGGDYPVDLSVGCAFMRDGTADTLEDLIRLADSRMYEDKNDYYRRNGLDRRK